MSKRGEEREGERRESAGDLGVLLLSDDKERDEQIEPVEGRW